MTAPPRADEIAAAQVGRAMGLAVLSGLTGAFAALSAVGTVPWWAYPLALFLAAWAVCCVMMFRVLLPMMIAELRKPYRPRISRRACRCAHFETPRPDHEPGPTTRTEP
jgi:hypothetical protein